MLNRFLMIAAIGVGLFVTSVPLHNLVSGLFKIEEPVFFLIAVVAAPVLVAMGIVGSLVVVVKGLFSKRT